LDAEGFAPTSPFICNSSCPKAWNVSLNDKANIWMTGKPGYPFVELTQPGKALEFAFTVDSSKLRRIKLKSYAFMRHLRKCNPRVMHTQPLQLPPQGQNLLKMPMGSCKPTSHRVSYPSGMG
jgi:hypothetical protein